MTQPAQWKRTRTGAVAHQWLNRATTVIAVCGVIALRRSLTDEQAPKCPRCARWQK